MPPASSARSGPCSHATVASPTGPPPTATPVRRTPDRAREPRDTFCSAATTPGWPSTGAPAGCGPASATDRPARPRPGRRRRTPRCSRPPSPIWRGAPLPSASTHALGSSVASSPLPTRATWRGRSRTRIRRHASPCRSQAPGRSCAPCTRPCPSGPRWTTWPSGCRSRTTAYASTSSTASRPMGGTCSGWPSEAGTGVAGPHRRTRLSSSVRRSASMRSGTRRSPRRRQATASPSREPSGRAESYCLVEWALRRPFGLYAAGHRLEEDWHVAPPVPAGATAWLRASLPHGVVLEAEGDLGALSSSLGHAFNPRFRVLLGTLGRVHARTVLAGRTLVTNIAFGALAPDTSGPVRFARRDPGPIGPVIRGGPAARCLDDLGTTVDHLFSAALNADPASREAQVSEGIAEVMDKSRCAMDDPSTRPTARAYRRVAAQLAQTFMRAPTASPPPTDALLRALGGDADAALPEERGCAAVGRQARRRNNRRARPRAPVEHGRSHERVRAGRSRLPVHGRRTRSEPDRGSGHRRPAPLPPRRFASARSRQPRVRRGSGPDRATAQHAARDELAPPPITPIAVRPCCGAWPAHPGLATCRRRHQRAPRRPEGTARTQFCRFGCPRGAHVGPPAQAERAVAPQHRRAQHPVDPGSPRGSESDRHSVKNGGCTPG